MVRLVLLGGKFREARELRSQVAMGEADVEHVLLEFTKDEADKMLRQMDTIWQVHARKAPAFSRLLAPDKFRRAARKGGLSRVGRIAMRQVVADRLFLFAEYAEAQQLACSILAATRMGRHLRLFGSCLSANTGATVHDLLTADTADIRLI